MVQLEGLHGSGPAQSQSRRTSPSKPSESSSPFQSWEWWAPVMMAFGKVVSEASDLLPARWARTTTRVEPAAAVVVVVLGCWREEQEKR